MAKKIDWGTGKPLKFARNEWCPAPLTINGLKQFKLPCGDTMVNAFVVWDAN
jgi:hypothetical protein